MRAKQSEEEHHGKESIPPRQQLSSQELLTADLGREELVSGQRSLLDDVLMQSNVLMLFIQLANILL